MTPHELARRLDALKAKLLGLGIDPHRVRTALRSMKSIELMNDLVAQGMSHPQARNATAKRYFGGNEQRLVDCQLAVTALLNSYRLRL